MSTIEAQEYWEQHYGAHDRVWTGRVNAQLADAVESLRPGRALDLGCGEGADAPWRSPAGGGALSPSTSRIPHCNEPQPTRLTGAWSGTSTFSDTTYLTASP